VNLGKPILGRIVAAALAAVLALGPAAAPAADQTDLIVFDVVLKGLRAGRLTLTGVVEGGNYRASGTLQSAGIVRLVAKVRYDAEASGRLRNGRYVPARYSEVADTGRRVSESVMEYRGGVPQVKTYNPPRPPQTGDVKPDTQGGTVDPLTALYATLRDVPAAEACTLDVHLFDGMRRSQIALSKPVPEADGVACTGEYRRLAGFSDKEMAEKVSFAFRLIYAPVGDGMLRVNLIETDTIFGPGYLRRR
jgi:hypothetical protein